MDESERRDETLAAEPRRPAPGDDDLLHGGSGEQGPPDGPAADETTDDLLNGGSGETEPAAASETTENEPPVKRHDGQVYGG